MNTVIKIFLVNNNLSVFSPTKDLEVNETSQLFLIPTAAGRRSSSSNKRERCLTDGQPGFRFYFSLKRVKHLSTYLEYSSCSLCKYWKSSLFLSSLLLLSRLEHHLYSFMAQFVTLGMTLDSSVSQRRGAEETL